MSNYKWLSLDLSLKVFSWLVVVIDHILNINSW